MLGGTRVATSDFVLFLPFLLALDEIIHISWEVVVVESTTGRWIGWVRRGCLLATRLGSSLGLLRGRVVDIVALALLARGGSSWRSRCA